MTKEQKPKNLILIQPLDYRSAIAQSLLYDRFSTASQLLPHCSTIVHCRSFCTLDPIPWTLYPLPSLSHCFSIVNQLFGYRLANCWSIVPLSFYDRFSTVLIIMHKIIHRMICDIIHYTKEDCYDHFKDRQKIHGIFL